MVNVTLPAEMPVDSLRGREISALITEAGTHTLIGRWSPGEGDVKPEEGP